MPVCLDGFGSCPCIPRTDVVIGMAPGFCVGGTTAHGAWVFDCTVGRAVDGATYVGEDVLANVGNGGPVVVVAGKIGTGRIGCTGSRLVNGGCCEVVAATRSPGNTGTQLPGLFVVGVGAATVGVSFFLVELDPMLKPTTPSAPACASPSAVALTPRRARSRASTPNFSRACNTGPLLLTTLASTPMTTPVAFITMSLVCTT